MTKSSNLPPAPFPTYHPSYREGRYPLINVFQLMLIGYESPPLEGDKVRANLATYTDPYSEFAIHQAVEESRRWLQGVDIQLGETQAVPYLTPLRGRKPANMPKDRVFSGNILNMDANVNVVGVMHPQRYGWLALEAAFPFDHPESVTIADLKAAIGQISVDKASELNTMRLQAGSFIVNGQPYM